MIATWLAMVVAVGAFLFGYSFGYREGMSSGKLEILEDDVALNDEGDKP